MSDLPKDLREMADHLWDVEHRINVDDDAKTLVTAADEIDRLRDRVAELQAERGYTESIQSVEIERLKHLCATAANSLRGQYAPRYEIAKLLDTASLTTGERTDG